MEVTAVGFEPTQLALVEFESTPLDHSGKWSLCFFLSIQQGPTERVLCQLSKRGIVF